MNGHIKKDRRANLLRSLTTELDLLPKWARSSVISVGRSVKKDGVPDVEALSVVLVALLDARSKERASRKPAARRPSRPAPSVTPAVAPVPPVAPDAPPARSGASDPLPSGFSDLLAEEDEEGTSDPFEHFAERMTGNDMLGRRVRRGP